MEKSVDRDDGVAGGEGGGPMPRWELDESSMTGSRRRAKAEGRALTEWRRPNKPIYPQFVLVLTFAYNLMRSWIIIDGVCSVPYL